MSCVTVRVSPTSFAAQVLHKVSVKPPAPSRNDVAAALIGWVVVDLISSVCTAAPSGTHNAEVFRDLLGLDENEVADLSRRSVI